MNIFVEQYTLQSGSSVSTQECMEDNSARRNHILEQQYAAEKRQKDLDAFTSESKDFLLTEALTYILKKCLPENISEALMTRGKAIVESFVKEEDSYSLLSKFKTKTLFLSELASIVEETHKKVIHGCEGKESPFKISNSDMKAFHDKLDTMDTDSVTKEIISRVTKAEEEFVKANVNDRKTLEELSSSTEEKLNSIKNKNQEMEDDIKKEAVAMYRNKVNSISDRKKGILESIVVRMGKSIVTEESLLPQFQLESGKLDMEKIIDTSEVMYTFLEMVNTLQIRNVDCKYLEDILSSIK